MSEEVDGEIEFLDEDADIVQQCVLSVEPTGVAAKSGAPLLIERVPNDRQKSNKRKRKKDADDTDYDPSEDLQVVRKSKRRQQQILNQQVRQAAGTAATPVSASNGSLEATTNTPDSAETQKKPRVISRYDLAHRKKLDIRIPDYEDPLCLPVRATKPDKDGVLESWNNLCLEQFKRCEKPLRAEDQETVSSIRTVVLRNQRHLQTDNIETTMYSKLSVMNKNGAKKAELLQSVLPKYREKKIVYNFSLAKKKKNNQKFRNKTEVLLTKEVGNDFENLVVYETRDALSSVYRMIEEQSEANTADCMDKKYLKEIACCKVCARCYQSSWRATELKVVHEKIECQICNKPSENIYKLLTHFKDHSASEVRAQKSSLTEMLADAVSYHYKCRICQKQCSSIKALRDHINTHKGGILFICEVGNHVTK